MPNFYARQVLEKEPVYCISEHFDKYFSWLNKFTNGYFGTCNSMNDYNFGKDTDGNPIIKDCQKYNFGIFYQSKEAKTLFRSIYANK
jgi:hypothetical protein